MLGVILAGGTGSRLKPLTHVTNKHLLPVYNKPMIYYPLELLKSLGIKEIALVAGREFAGDFSNLFSDGSEYGVSFTYKVQHGAPGIAHAMGLVERIAGKEPILAILGDNIFMIKESELEKIRNRIEHFNMDPSGAMLFLKDVPDANRFGVAEFDAKGRLLGIEEKPKKPKSNYAVTGLYMYDNTVFDKIKMLKPSARNEIEVTDLNNHYLREGGLKYHILKGEWTDAGTFESLHRANILAKRMAEAEAQRGAVQNAIQIHEA